VQNADDRSILPEWLDFREGEISSLTVNGQPASTKIQNGHVQLSRQSCSSWMRMWL